MFPRVGCPVRNEPLGSDYQSMERRAETLNGLLDEWQHQRKGQPVTSASMPKYGTVDWLFREYKISAAYLEKVAQRSRRDYEWAMDEICNVKTKTGDRVGDRPVKTISPRAADKLYDKFIAATDGADKQRLRTGEKLVGLCRKAWRVVHRLFPDQFDKDVPNPWAGVTLKCAPRRRRRLLRAKRSTSLPTAA